MTALGDRHREQARLNRTHAEYLSANPNTDPTSLQWAVTAAFYCAVHCMQGYLVDRGLDPQNHYDRRLAIADPANGIPPQVQYAYRGLYQQSVKARYRFGAFTRAVVRGRILDYDLRTITTFVGL